MKGITKSSAIGSNSGQRLFTENASTKSILKFQELNLDKVAEKQRFFFDPVLIPEQFRAAQTTQPTEPRGKKGHEIQFDDCLLTMTTVPVAL